jgi:hypothetical protein
MGQFVMTMTALVAFGARVATAQGEIGGGAPPRNAGQCFKYSARDVAAQDGRSAAGVLTAGEQEHSYSAYARVRGSSQSRRAH